MGVLAFDAKKVFRPALLTIARYLLIISATLLTTVGLAHASGNLVTPPASLFYVSSWVSCVPGTEVSYPNPSCTIQSSPLSCADVSIAALQSCVAGAVGGPVHINNYYGNFTRNSPWGFTDAISNKLGCKPEHSQLVGTVCSCIDPYVPDPAKTSCVKEQYKLSLTPDTATIEPGKTYTFTATVTNQDGITPIEDVPVSVKVEVDPTSGGHDHGGSDRPKGSVSPASGNTALSITFTSTEISGTHTITATCDLCNNGPQTATIYVKVKELTTLTESSDYELIGGETGKAHTDNHYLTATAKENLLAIVEKYNKKYPDGPLLHLNDASLIWGGKFDISGHWTGDHKEHRRGEAIDIRANQLDTAIPETRFKDLQSYAAKNGASANLHCNPPYSRTCPGCILDNRPNRHFHVYLLGK